MSSGRIFIFERCSDIRRFFLYKITLIGQSLHILEISTNENTTIHTLHALIALINATNDLTVVPNIHLEDTFQIVVNHSTRCSPKCVNTRTDD